MYELSQPSLAVVVAVASLVVIPGGDLLLFLQLQFNIPSCHSDRSENPPPGCPILRSFIAKGGMYELSQPSLQSYLQLSLLLSSRRDLRLFLQLQLYILSCHSDRGEEPPAFKFSRGRPKNKT
jgi:hypothetical protein